MVLFKKRDGWRIRTNLELNKLNAGGNRVRFIKAQTLNGGAIYKGWRSTEQ